MEKKKKRLAFILLIMVINCNAIQYIGSKQLCCIDSNNNEVCLQTNQTYDFSNSDLSCALQNEDYAITKDNMMDIPYMLITVFTVIVLIYIFLLITKKK